MHDELALSLWRRMDAWLTNAGVGTRTTHAILNLTTLGLPGAVNGLVWTTGGAQGPYLPMAYVPIVLAAVIGGVRAALVTGLVAAVLMGSLMPLNVAEGVPQATGAWLFRGLFFLLIGLFVAIATGILRSRNPHDIAPRGPRRPLQPQPPGLRRPGREA